MVVVVVVVAVMVVVVVVVSEARVLCGGVHSFGGKVHAPWWANWPCGHTAKPQA